MNRHRPQLQRQRGDDFPAHGVMMAPMKWYKDRKYLVGSILLPTLLAVIGWIYANSSSSDSISNAPNNAGIITQGQSGNNVIITAPSPPAPC